MSTTEFLSQAHSLVSRRRRARRNQRVAIALCIVAALILLVFGGI